MLQRSDEWFLARVGCCSASKAADVLSKIKSGESASRRKYRIQLVTERLSGAPVETYQNAAMEWGTLKESEARESYEAETGVMVQEVGFVLHKKVPWCGASPDGLIDDDGLFEAKCPLSTTHIDWMERGVMPPEHIPQVQFQMWVTDRKWCDFVSYDPRFPPNLQLFIVRVPRDDSYIKTMEAEVKDFLAGVDEMVQKLLARK